MRYIAPSTGTRSHLQSSRRVFGAQYRQHSVVGMRSGPELPGRRRHRLLRVVDHAQ